MTKQAKISGEKHNDSEEQKEKFDETLEQGNLELDRPKDDKYEKDR